MPGPGCRNSCSHSAGSRGCCFFFLPMNPLDRLWVSILCLSVCLCPPSCQVNRKRSPEPEELTGNQSMALGSSTAAVLLLCLSCFLQLCAVCPQGTGERNTNTWCLTYCKWYLSKSANQSCATEAASFVILQFWHDMDGAFPLPCNPTWQLEHPGSISNKMTTRWNFCISTWKQIFTAFYKGHQRCSKVPLFLLSDEDSLISFNFSLAVSHRKPRELQEAPSPEEEMEKYF